MRMGFLLDFCASKWRAPLQVMGTLHQHREYGTWLHNSSRRWYQIDHVLCPRQTAGLVTNVRVMPGYHHDTDHKCLRMSLRIPRKATLGRFYAGAGNNRGDARPPRLAVHKLCNEEVAAQLNATLHDLIEEGTIQEEYDMFGYALRRITAGVVGKAQPQFEAPWKVANQEKLAELSWLKREAAARAPLGTRAPEYKAACQ